MSLNNLVAELKIIKELSKKRKSRGWTDEEIKKESDKYQYLSTWQKGHNRTYMSAWRQGRLPDFSKHMVRKLRKPPAP